METLNTPGSESLLGKDKVPPPFRQRGPEGSGEKALAENERMIAEMEAMLHDLRTRAASGENVDSEVMSLKAHFVKAKEDRGRINEAGM